MGEGFGIEFPEVSGLPELGRRVNDAFEALPFPANFRKQGGHGLRIGYVEPRGAVLGAKQAGGFVNFLRGGREPELVARGREVSRDFQADAAATAGDENAGRLRGKGVRSHAFSSGKRVS